ncbi:toll/interleukin-1 receptor domain-containing protein [Aliarcobacter butzleri]|uniref:toll/interleukin-1 receptor domain-containing protein n=1 Tax=Aliarcobacter butzleri TaxID=28197 RepID=UPI002B254A73|nr:TIR domain-containing protein [Aliarcobacter butzleri]
MTELKENKSFDYDVALSFAGEDREYVEDVATFLKDVGIKVFYDKFEADNLWGKNLYDHLQDIYKNKANYTILFISEHYKKKNWTTHERQSAQARAFEESREYILPVKFDDTEIPGIQSTVGYLNAKEYSPIDIAKNFIKKIGFEANKRWWGKWERDNTILSNNGDLFIREVKNEGFYFDLLVQNGAHIGNIENEFAKFISYNEALFEYAHEFNNEVSRIHFLKVKDQIQLTPENCNYFCGMRAYFDGTYKFKKDFFTYHEDIIDDIILSKIYMLINDDKKLFIEHIDSKWKDFLKCFSSSFSCDNLDDFQAEIIESSLPGFYSEYAAILMIGKNKEIWGAYFDVPEMYYFTTEKEYKKNFPKTINEWMKRFKNYNMNYLNNHN